MNHIQDRIKTAIAQNIHSLIAWTQSCFSPRKCSICSFPQKSNHDICSSCLARIAYLREEHCMQCARPFAIASPQLHHCSDCLERRFHFSKAYVCFEWTPQISDALHAIKFGKSLHTLKALSQLAQEAWQGCIAEFQPDLIIPVPLSLPRRISRGFNQASMLVHYLQKHNSKKTPLFHALGRKHSSPQAQKKRTERLKISPHTFILDKKYLTNKNLQGQKLLLVDDIMTTGSTLNALTQSLRQAKAKDVRVFSLIRATNSDLQFSPNGVTEKDM